MKKKRKKRGPRTNMIATGGNEEGGKEAIMAGQVKRRWIGTNRLAFRTCKGSWERIIMTDILELAEFKDMVLGRITVLKVSFLGGLGSVYKCISIRRWCGRCMYGRFTDVAMSCTVLCRKQRVISEPAEVNHTFDVCGDCCLPSTRSADRLHRRDAQLRASIKLRVIHRCT